MKKFKSSIEDILKKGVPVDLDPDWYEKRIEAVKEAKEKARKMEQERIDKIKCPSCKSTRKIHVEKRNDNGIIGPGYSSWLIDDYYVCAECGTMFKDLNKKEENKWI